MPVIKFDVADHMFKSGVQNNITIQGLYFVGTTTAAAKYAINNNVSSAGAFAKGSTFIFGCVLDQFSFDVGLALSSTTGFFGTFVFGSEVFSSAAGSTGSQAAAFAQAQDLSVDSCNFHDCIGHGVSTGSGSPAVTIIGSIIAKCQSNGVNYGSIGTLVLKNNTIDGNLGHGLIVTNANENNNNNNVANNIFSNHTQAGKFGIDIQVNAGAATTGFFDYNVFYNNTSNYNNLTAGVHDTALGVTPYVGQPTENYTLA
jgi:hypothetical protein